MTKDEARTKWCPMARAPYFDPENLALGYTSVNRPALDDYGNVESTVDCIADRCAKWEWGLFGLSRKRGRCGL